APPGPQLHHSLDQRWNPLGGDRRFRRAAGGGALYVGALLAAALTVPQMSPAGRILTELVYMVPEAAAAVALFVVGRRSSWAPWFWYLLGASMVAGLIGDANWALYDFVLGLPPVPSLGDIAYTMQPILMTLAALAAFPLTRPRLGDVADIAVPFAGALMVTYDVVIRPQLAVGVSAATIPVIVEMQATLVAALMFTTAISGVRGLATGVKLIYAGLLIGAASYPLYS